MAPASPDLPLTRVSPGVAAVLPFLYVAWADGHLRPEEVADIRARVEALEWLSDEDRAQLTAWLDPEHPPSATVYFGWVRALRHAARQQAEAGEPLTLADAGAALAAYYGEDGQGETALGEAERTALAEMEAALGVAGSEVLRELVAPRAPVAGDGALAPAAPPVPAEPPAFDVAALRAHLDGPRAPMRDRVRKLLEDPLFTYPHPEIDRESYQALVLGWTRRLADEGLGALAMPEYVGGGGDIGEFIAAFETIAYFDLNLMVKYGVQFGLFGGSIAQLGSRRHHEQYLPAAASLALPGCFAMSERQHGSNVRDLQTTATYDPETDTFVVHTPQEEDHKEWIGNAARHARVATVFAQLVVGEQNYGVHALLVPIRDEAGHPMPGVRIGDSGHKMGLNGIDNGQLWFDHVRVPRENLLDRFAQVSPEGEYASAIPSASKRFFVMLGTLVGGRIAVASGATSASKAALTIAVRYGARRRQFGPAGQPEVPLLDYLSHQRRLLPRLATSYALNFAVHRLAETFAALPPDADTRETEAHAAALKALASWHATDSLQGAREACGGEGYRWSTRLANRKADADIFTSFEGDNTVLMLQVAKGLLAGYQQEFTDLSFRAVLRYLRDLSETRFGEINPLARRQADPERLRDPDFHAELFARRERILLVSAARRLKQRIDRGMDSFDAFIEVQDHLLTLARAHGERLVLAAFREGVEACEDARLRAVLEQVYALYALSRIEADRGWFLEENLFEANVAKAVRAEVNTLCDRLRPVAVELVDAFGIPDQALGSAIA